MIVKERACCFTGHRRLSSSPDLADALKKTILAKINEGYFDFLSGMALGFDSLAAQTILNLKKEFPLIRLFCIIPCADQDKDFSAAQKETYRSILQQADEIIILQETYSRGCMHVRNRYLVDHSACVIAYLTRKNGGTAYTVSYANKQEKNIFNVASLIDRRNHKCLGAPNVKRK